MKIIACEQGSTEWLEARRGIATASEFSRIITPKTGKLSASADELIYELLAERLGAPLGNTFTSRAAQNGITTEPEARRFYELHANLDVVQVGFCLSDCGRHGCSPDGLVGEEGGLELKCPAPKTQVKYLIEHKLPDEYRAQVHGCLIVTGRAWWDFLSYAEGLEPLLIRVVPDSYTDQLRAALEEFHKKFEAMLKQLQNREVA